MPTLGYISLANDTILIWWSKWLKSHLLHQLKQSLKFDPMFSYSATNWLNKWESLFNNRLAVFTSLLIPHNMCEYSNIPCKVRSDMPSEGGQGATTPPKRRKEKGKRKRKRSKERKSNSKKFLGFWYIVSLNMHQLWGPCISIFCAPLPPPQKKKENWTYYHPWVGLLCHT